MFLERLHDIFFAPFNGFGHLSLMNPRAYHILLHRTSQHYIEGEPWRRIMYNPASLAFYGPPPEWLADLDDHEAAPPVEDNVITEILEEGKIALVRIRTFTPENIPGDMEYLLAFFTEISDFEHLILDIRGNGGGTGDYFNYVIMALLIDEPVSYVNYFFAMDGEHIKRFFYDDDIESEMNPIQGEYGNIFDALPMINQDDAEILSFYYQVERVVYPSNYSIAFEGKIWLLIDGRTFSASDAFARASKQIGFATLVGVPTSGGGMGTDPIVAALPNTGIIASFQGFYGTDHQGRHAYEFTTHNHTTPTAAHA